MTVENYVVMSVIEAVVFTALIIGFINEKKVKRFERKLASYIARAIICVIQTISIYITVLKVWRKEHNHESDRIS